ncbi:MAG: hypothetical protein IIC82_07820, partial [Chloroflexi bacterium]|nr:hypothetical protein [Chloroflexota bacterium]
MTTQTAAIDRLPEHLQEDAREFAEHYLPAYDELLQGHPRQMVEAFLWIDDKVTQQVVRFNYNVNQIFADGEIYDDLTWWQEDGFEAVILKDRQATMTSKFQGDGFVAVVCIEGTQVVHVFQDEDTGKQLTARLDLFWKRLNQNFLNHDGRVLVKVSDSRMELRVEHWQDGKFVGLSTYLVISAGAREFGAGIAPNFIIFDEYDLYPNYDLVGRINAAKGSNCKTIKPSTPRGQGQLHEDYTAAKEGRSGAIAVAIYCFQNPLSALDTGHRLSPPAFRFDFDLLPEHLYILNSPEWEERSVHKEDPERFFRWWEWKRQEIRQRLAGEGIHDEERVLGEQEQEHCTNDHDCFSNFGKTPFSRVVRQDYETWAKKRELRRDETPVPGFQYKQYIPPQPGMVYAMGMDSARGRPGGDAIAAVLKDAAGNYVATLYGRCDLGKAIRAVVDVMKEYTTVMQPLFAPEIDGGLGLFAIEEAKRNGHTNFWYKPKKLGDDINKFNQKPKEYGWRTQGNKDAMVQRGVARFNTRDALLWDVGLLRDMSNYDPELDRHTSDRLMAYFIAEAITDPHHPKKFGVQFAAMSTKVRGIKPEGKNRPKKLRPRHQ